MDKKLAGRTGLCGKFTGTPTIRVIIGEIYEDGVVFIYLQM